MKIKYVNCQALDLGKIFCKPIFVSILKTSIPYANVIPFTNLY